MSNLKELIDSIIDGDTISIQNNFNAEMTSRLSDVLDVYRTQVAMNLFNKEEEVPVENEE